MAWRGVENGNDETRDNSPSRQWTWSDTCSDPRTRKTTKCRQGVSIVLMDGWAHDERI